MSDIFERKVITPAEREARKAFKEVDAAKAMNEHERAQKAFHENRERLKALRLARETEPTKAKWFRIGTQRCLNRKARRDVPTAERDAGEWIDSLKGDSRCRTAIMNPKLESKFRHDRTTPVVRPTKPLMV
jgi:hypothetical protein